MLLNLAVATVIARFTPPPSPEVQALIESIRVPRGAGPSTEITA
jgi:cation/acetate symporter